MVGSEPVNSYFAVSSTTRGCNDSWRHKAYICRCGTSCRPTASEWRCPSDTHSSQTSKKLRELRTRKLANRELGDPQQQARHVIHRDGTPDEYRHSERRRRHLMVKSTGLWTRKIWRPISRQIFLQSGARRTVLPFAGRCAWASGCRGGITDGRSCAEPRDANLSCDLLSNVPLRTSFIPFHYWASPGRRSDLRHRGGRCPPRWRARCASGRPSRRLLAASCSPRQSISAGRIRHVIA